MSNSASSPNSPEVAAGVPIDDFSTPGCVDVDFVVTLLAVFFAFISGLFSLPVTDAVTPGIVGKFFGGDLDIGEFRICIRNERS